VEPTTIETRSYRILGVLGKGGFGKVYRARLEGAAGFSKDVAIKLLTDKEPGDDILNRFRDESRILGLLRDRAMVSVDPPAQLNGRWAIIMECVDGVSARRLLRAHGPLPITIALEMVQEVARALDHAYTAPGPEGESLELVHRDLKPDNLQLTPQGHVKILDFGTARARFGAREAETTRSIAGTYGYIAPERLMGIDTPAGDVYSLGMVLHRLLTGQKADPVKVKQAREASGSADPDLHKALGLVLRMTDEDPNARPTAREVEDACQELRRELEGPTLRRWAPDVVTPLQELGTDEMVGKTLSSTFQIHSDEVTATQSRSRLMLIAAALGINLAGLTAIVVILLAGIGIIGTAAYYNQQASYVPPPPTPIVEPAPAPSETRPAEPAPVAPAPVEPVEPAPRPSPVPTPVTQPRPRPAPSPKPAPAATPLKVMVNSNPLGAAIIVDGKKVGTTPDRALMLSPGSHELQLDLPSGAVRRTVTIGADEPNTFIWTGERWAISTRSL